MRKGSTADVIDLAAFREKKQREGRAPEAATMPRAAAVLVPVWFCWVPVWAPVT